MDDKLFYMLVGAGIAVVTTSISVVLQHVLSLRSERLKLRMKEETDRETRKEEEQQRKEAERRRIILEGVHQYALKTSHTNHGHDVAERVAGLVAHSISVQLEDSKDFRRFIYTAFDTGTAQSAIRSVAKQAYEQIVEHLKQKREL